MKRYVVRASSGSAVSSVIRKLMSEMEDAGFSPEDYQESEFASVAKDIIRNAGSGRVSIEFSAAPMDSSYVEFAIIAGAKEFYAWVDAQNPRRYSVGMPEDAPEEIKSLFDI